ncbi:hypothetical protein CERSUDRAFT_91391 [Gelatoporia subvermispora B]|uniref:Uncharacterized protein n=1 Tax=Ceriporiopsis subvermispora (strain B) TaxID=914234 RepID=M2QUA9_CERS8|nr:hypothetical protein CERSUDRAFT_91391 [Gelatoporia subvermispora B]
MANLSGPWFLESANDPDSVKYLTLSTYTPASGTVITSAWEGGPDQVWQFTQVTNTSQNVYTVRHAVSGLYVGYPDTGDDSVYLTSSTEPMDWWLDEVDSAYVFSWNDEFSALWAVENGGGASVYMIDQSSQNAFSTIAMFKVYVATDVPIPTSSSSFHSQSITSPPTSSTSSGGSITPTTSSTSSTSSTASHREVDIVAGAVAASIAVLALAGYTGYLLRKEKWTKWPFYQSSYAPLTEPREFEGRATLQDR